MAEGGPRHRAGLGTLAVAACLALAAAACSGATGDPAPPMAGTATTTSPSATLPPTSDPPGARSELAPPEPNAPTASPMPTTPGPSPTVRTHPEGVVHTSGVAYGTHERQVIDTYVPAAHVPSPTQDPDRRPTMVLVHGGGWTAGHRGVYDQMAMSLASQGWVAVTVGYRLAPAHRHPDAVGDVRDALQHVHDHAAELDVDPTRVVLGGDSAGGNLSGLVALADDRPPVAAWISWSGVHDFVALAEQLADDQAWLRERMSAYLGCEDPDASDCVDRARAASPVALASADDPPTLLVHSADELVPLSDAETMRRALDDAGAQVTLQIYEGAAHGMQLQARSAQAVETFLMEALNL